MLSTQMFDQICSCKLHPVTTRVAQDCVLTNNRVVDKNGTRMHQEFCYAVNVNIQANLLLQIKFRPLRGALPASS